MTAGAIKHVTGVSGPRLASSSTAGALAWIACGALTSALTPDSAELFSGG